MKKASRLSCLVAGIIGAISIITSLGLFAYLMSAGFEMALYFVFWGLERESYGTMLIAIPVAFSIWVAAFSMIPLLIRAIITTVLGFVGSSKRGNKKPLMIVALVLSIIGLASRTTIGSIFLIEGSVLGLGAVDDEKEQVEKEADLELQQVEDILEQ